MSTLDATIRCRVVVHGYVQGVWFRDSCRNRARELDVRGWVRNRLDGTVEGRFEGRAADVAQLVAWCRQGPIRAEVTGVDVTEEPVDGVALVGFQIR